MLLGNISKRFSLSGIEIPRYGGACPRWNVYSAFSRPGVIQAAVSKMTNGEKYVCIARTVEKGVGRYGQKKSMLSIGLGCEAKYAKDFVYTENLSLSDKKTEIPIGVSCRTCDRLDCSQRAFPPLHKKFDVDVNARGVSVYVSDWLTFLLRSRYKSCVSESTILSDALNISFDWYSSEKYFSWLHLSSITIFPSGELSLI